MKKLICLSALACLFTALAVAQSTGADVDFLYTNLKKTPSYKAQINGDKAVAYQKLYERVKQDLPNKQTDLERFHLLSQLLVPIKDNHLAFYQHPEKEVTAEMFKDTAAMRQYRATAEYKAYPKSKLNLDSLENALKAMPKDSVEGIYYYGRGMKAGLYRTHQKDSLVAVVLETYFPNWEKGQIAFILKEDRPKHFTAYHGHIMNKTFQQIRHDKFIRGQLTETNWKKEIDKLDIANLPSNTPQYLLKSLSPEIQYLRLGNFRASDEDLAVAEKFHQQIKDSLLAPNLIVDLRNNGGGAFKNSQRFLNVLKAYGKHGKIYAIINNRTFSNAEQFTLELKGIKNATLLGEHTNGTITYGSNYGHTLTLPSGKYKLYLTDMKEGGDCLPYEGIGIAPDVFLNADKDWVEQVKEKIGG